MSGACGFTLVELLVALVVALIVIAAVYSTFVVHQQHFGKQRLMMRAQQNLRGALLILEQELRMVGYDPEDSGGFGVVDVRRYDLVRYRECNPDGQPVLFYTYDVDEDGRLDDDNNQRNKEHAKFRISDKHNDGHICLTWDNGAGRNPLAENIQAIGFAFAIDRDGDGRCDSWPGGGDLIWAVDSNNDNMLDADLDTNGDGVIDEEDDANGDRRIDMADGRPLKPQVSLRCIKAVRVWALAVTPGRLQGGGDFRNHVVGDRILTPADDGKARLVLQTRVQCRNL
ncbi:MAG: prepilin-type N-terminal cleavage/methylation domain-containing protein [Desulfobacteraceae bacterium]